MSSSIETRRKGLMKPRKGQLMWACSVIKATCAPASTTAHQEQVMRINTLTRRLMVGVIQNRGLL